MDALVNEIVGTVMMQAALVATAAAIGAAALLSLAWLAAAALTTPAGIGRAAR